MASLLEGKLRKLIAKGFKGKLLRGTIRREVTASLDTAGNSVTTTPLTFTFEGIRSSFSAFYKAQAGIPDNDVKILVLLGSVKPATEVVQDDLIHLSPGAGLAARWHKVRRVLEIDPAEAAVTVQAYEVGAP